MKAIGLVGVATLVAIGAGIAVKADHDGDARPASEIGNVVDVEPAGGDSGVPAGDPDDGGAPDDPAAGLPPDGDPDGGLIGPDGTDDEDEEEKEDAEHHEDEDDEDEDEEDR